MTPASTDPAFSPKRPDPMQLALSDFQDQLMRGLAHRMNNILSLFHGYLGLLMEDKKLDAVTREGLAKIKDGATAATDLIERAHALVRPTSAVWREVNLGDLLRQMRPTLEGFCSPKVKLEIDCVDNLPTVWADASRLRMALAELVRNACEAAKTRVLIRVAASPGRVQGELFDTNAEAPEHWLTITIQDAAGLGLTVAIGCAQQLGGSVRHRSRTGETTFELVLPSRIALPGAADTRQVA
jgi:signal transduction histidine kinase